jgi:drug/metabolite transporter (DMT)-like permease
MTTPARIDPGALILVLGTVLALSIGQVLFKLAAEDLQFNEPRTFLSLRLASALVVYMLATIMWLGVLSKLPLSIAFPFYGLTFLLIPVLSAIWLDEPLRIDALIGGALIMLGVAVSARSSLS